MSISSESGDAGCRWAFGVFGAVTLHALLFVALAMRWQVAPRAMAAPEPTITVFMAAPSSPPRPVRDLAPGPRASERRKASHAPSEAKWRRSDFPAPPDDVLPVDTPPAHPEESAPTLASVQSSAPPTAPAPPAARVASNARDSWQGRVLAHLEKHRRYPGNARSHGVQGTAYVRFRLNRAGQVVWAVIQRSSGSAILDEAALDTIRRAQPLPPVPPEMADEVELAAPVEFYLSR